MVQNREKTAKSEVLLQDATMRKSENSAESGDENESGLIESEKGKTDLGGGDDFRMLGKDACLVCCIPPGATLGESIDPAKAVFINDEAMRTTFALDAILGARTSVAGVRGSSQLPSTLEFGL